MNYVGICFFNDVGRCLCGPVAAGGGSTLAANQSSSATVNDVRLSVPGGSMVAASTPLASASGGGAGRTAAYTMAGRRSGDSVSDFRSGTAASPSWSGGSGSGGAPAPEVNAGLGLLLAGITVAYLRRRRDRRLAQSPVRAVGLDGTS